MATNVQITAEEYLRTTFDGPEAEYVRGEIVERSLPDYVHASIQARLAALFVGLSKKYPLFPCTELRVKIQPDLYRVIDVAVFAGAQPADRLPAQPPFVAVEIVSRDDRHTHLLQKLEEYRNWGVQHVWLVDPWLRKLQIYDAGGLKQAPLLSLSEYSFELTISELLERLA